MRAALCCTLLGLCLTPAAAQWIRDGRTLGGIDAGRRLRARGGDIMTGNAAALALGWLARHQDDDGRWGGFAAPAPGPCSWNPDVPTIDLEYWHLGSLGLFQVGGGRWRTWTKAMKPALVKHQHQKGSGTRTGSWDPIGPWGRVAGRVASTAVAARTLEVYSLYARIFGTRWLPEPKAK
ncbi:MAG: hypothetical protein ACE5JG_05600 [Planctomycetota bacterium]